MRCVARSDSWPPEGYGVFRALPGGVEWGWGALGLGKSSVTLFTPQQLKAINSVFFSQYSHVQLDIMKLSMDVAAVCLWRNLVSTDDGKLFFFFF